MEKRPTTYCAYFRKKQSGDEEGYIGVRVTSNRKSKFVPLKVRLNEKYWNSARKIVKKSHPESESLNERLENLMMTLKQNEQKESVSPETILAVVERAIYRAEMLNQFAVLGTLNSLLHHLTIFDERKKNSVLRTNKVAGTIVNDFYLYLCTEGLAISTANKYLKNFVKILTDAAKYGELVVMNEYSLSVKLKSSESIPVSLTKRDLYSIAELKLPENTGIFLARNGFMFQAFGQGIRCSDLMLLRWSNFRGKLDESCFNFYQLKTRAPLSLLLTLPLIRWILPYLPYECTMTYYNSELVNAQNELESAQNFDERSVVLEKKKELAIEEGRTYRKLIVDIFEYSRAHLDDFVFPFLLLNISKEVPIIEPQIQLSKKVYRQLSSAQALYNKRLKKVASMAGLTLELRSHHARHTYTNLKIEDNINGFAISASLGHRKMDTINAYAKKNNIELIKDANSSSFF